MGDYKYLFGPVPSRRFGRSLGVDLTPYKTCSLDCVFCQLGRTTNKTVHRLEYVPTDSVLAELGEWLAKNTEVTAGTFWGNGVNTTGSAPMALQGMEPLATWFKASPKTLIKPFRNPGAVKVIVTGGAIQTTWFVTDFRPGRGILIDEWK